MMLTFAVGLFEYINTGYNIQIQSKIKSDFEKRENRIVLDRKWFEFR